MNNTVYYLISENIITGSEEIIFSDINKELVLNRLKLANILLDIKINNAKFCAECNASKNKSYYTEQDAKNSYNDINCQLTVDKKQLTIRKNISNDCWYINCPKNLDLIHFQCIKYKIVENYTYTK